MAEAPSSPLSPSSHLVPAVKSGVILSLALITLTVCVVYVAVFEYQNQVIFNMTMTISTVDFVVILTLAFGIQTKTLFLNT